MYIVSMLVVRKNILNCNASNYF